MTTSIDNKVVSAKFDNEGFGRKISETIGLIDKFKAKLNFSGAVKGISELDNAAKGVNMNPLGVAVEGINKKFLALSTVAITALSNITTKVMTTGTQMLKSLSVQPLMDGFKEYETNMNSIQTILANTDSKGSTLDDVNRSLEELNRYSDQTIYNFSEMARNIGTFTAAGVDLETSTSSIKGIANLAAISGSNSEQASTAMYQLSQAIANGSLKLMDWNSVVNAGMGGEVFQKALFESGKAMKTLTDVPMDMTFEEWTDAGNTFRGSLESGWLTGEVLTSTLQGFTGDLTEAQIMSMGYTKDQAAEMMRLGKIGKAAATEVKTITQLMSTVKESIASGWSASFKTIFGDFEEAKKLFTDIGGNITGFVAKTAEARNNILGFWKYLGGRDVLISALQKSLVFILGPLDRLQKAFREFFPRKTGADLAVLTLRFKEFVERVRPTKETLDKLQNVFRGFFAILRIGFDVVKGIASVVGDMFSAIFNGGGPSAVLDLASKFGIFFVKLQQGTLSTENITEFFSKLGGTIAKVVGVTVEYGGKLISTIASIVSFVGGKLGGAIKQVASIIAGVGSAIFSFFGNLFGKDKKDKGDEKESKAGRLDKLKDSLSIFGKIADKANKTWDSFVNGMKAIGKGVATVVKNVVEAFSGLGSALGDGLSSGNFDNFIKLLKVALFGGILWQIKKFVKSLLDFDFGGGFIDKIKDALSPLTDTLEAMQLRIKSEAIMNIAKALAVLVVSLLVLAFIDGEKLKKALIATAVGLGQLVGIMTLLDKVSGSMTSQKTLALSGSMLMIAGAALLMAFAVKKLSSLSWQEMLTGLGGMVGMLLGMALAAKLMDGVKGSLFKTGLAMIGLSVAMLIMSFAIQKIIDLDSGKMLVGLLTLASSLVILSVAMRIMGDDKATLSKALAMIALTKALDLMAGVIITFSKIPFDVVKDGLLRIALALGVLALTLNIMPDNLPSIAFGLVLVSGALYVISKVIELFGNMKWEVIKQGLGGMAAVMLILALGVNALKDAGEGAVVMIAVAGAMFALFKVVEMFGKIPLGQLVTGLIAFAAVFAIIGVAATLMAPVIPLLVALGLGMMAIAGAFLLFGAGAYLAAKAFEVVADAGKHGVAVLIEIIKMLIAALPSFMEQLAISLVKMAETFLAQGPKLIEGFMKVLTSLVQAVIDFMPKLFEVFNVLIAGVIQTIRDRGPEFITMAFELLTAFMQGMRDNAYQLTVLAVEIITKLIQGITENVNQLTNAAVDLLLAFIGALANRALDIVNAGTELLVQLVRGIMNNIGKITEAVGKLIIRFIDAVGEQYTKIAKAGFDALLEFIAGMTRNIVKVTNAVGDLVTEFVKAVGEQGIKIAQAGTDTLVSFLNAIAQDTSRIAGAITNFIVNIVYQLGQQAGKIADAVLKAFVDALNGVASAIRNNSSDIRKAILNVADAILDGLTFGLSNSNAFIEAMKDLARKALGAINSVFEIFSPSRQMKYTGSMLVAGLVQGVSNNAPAVSASAKMATNVIAATADVFTSDRATANAAANWTGSISDAVAATWAERPITAPIAPALASGTALFERATNTTTTQAAETVTDSTTVPESMDTVVQTIDEKVPELKALGQKLGRALIDGMALGIRNRSGWLTTAALDVVKHTVDAMRDYLQIRSPSRVFMGIGQNMTAGLALAFTNDTSTVNGALGLSDKLTSAFDSVLNTIPDQLNGMNEFNPVITPVLNLDQVKMGAGKLNGLIQVSPISPAASYDQAGLISHTRDTISPPPEPSTISVPTETKFEQNIYGATSLNANDVYRNTKSQFSHAKKEFGFE